MFRNLDFRQADSNGKCDLNLLKFMGRIQNNIYQTVKILQETVNLFLYPISLQSRGYVIQKIDFLLYLGAFSTST